MITEQTHYGLGLRHVANRCRRAMGVDVVDIGELHARLHDGLAHGVDDAEPFGVRRRNVVGIG